jgi:endonuclease/exonuclease/phosphatase family metal-dependent hydrolase
MNIPLLTRRQTVDDQEVREPTLLALALVALGILLVLAVCALGVLAQPAFGYTGWVLAALAVLIWVLLALGRPSLRSGSPTGRQRWLRRLLHLGRRLLLAALACWLGLILWSIARRGGPAAEAKASPDLVRVVTWNIHCGQDRGLPWQQFDWPARKVALRAALEQAEPDILCVQEATPEQVAFLEEVLPLHRRVGIGRDGAAGGEHCAIFFRRERFEEIAGDTFWLEEPTDQPRAGSALDVKRICTWVRLRDVGSGRTLRVYNTHLYLTEAPRQRAARLILDHLAAGDARDAVLLTGDFNATPAAPSRRLFLQAGLADSAVRAGQPAGQPTFHLYGIGLWCIDGILVDSYWRVAHRQILDVKPGNVFPSDHFALLADLALAP